MDLPITSPIPTRKSSNIFSAAMMGLSWFSMWLRSSQVVQDWGEV